MSPDRFAKLALARLSGVLASRIPLLPRLQRVSDGWLLAGLLRLSGMPLIRLLRGSCMEVDLA